MGRPRLMFLVNSLVAVGGAEQFVLSHVRCADRRRFDVSVCQMGGKDTLAAQFAELGVPVHDMREWRRPDPFSIMRLARLLLRHPVDVLQAHIGYSVVVARVVGRLLRVPCVVTTEQAMPHQYPRRTLRALDLTARLPDAHVFISRANFEAAAARLPFLRGADWTIIPNGIDSRAIAATAAASRAEVRRELGLVDGALAFANCARLHPDKDQATLLDAFARIAPEVAEARLFIAGVGPLAGDLGARARSLGIADRVTFLGERTDVPRLLGGFDAYVHPSVAEALGIAALEAMSAGLPIIGAETDALPEYIEHGRTGWLFPQRDAAMLAERMRGIAARRDEAREVGRRGQEEMFARFDIRACVRAYEELYERLLVKAAA